MIALAFAGLAAVGSLARWQMARYNRADWPLGTLVVNLAAAFTLGLLHGAADGAVTVIGAGLLGSISTFSTVVREVTDTAESRPSAALSYLAATVAHGVGVAWVGIELS